MRHRYPLPLYAFDDACHSKGRVDSSPPCIEGEGSCHDLRSRYELLTERFRNYRPPDRVSNSPGSRAVIRVVVVTILAEFAWPRRSPGIAVGPEIGLLPPQPMIAAVGGGLMAANPAHERHQAKHPHRILDDEHPGIHFPNEGYRVLHQETGFPGLLRFGVVEFLPTFSQFTH